MNLLLTILLTSWLLISFRVFGKKGISNLAAIVVNYWVCVLVGVVFPGNSSVLAGIDSWQSWITMAFLTGACFLPTFFLMSYTVQKVSVTVATLASKTSLIIPVLVSLWFLTPGKVSLSLWLGLTTGLLAIVLSSLQKAEPSQQKVGWKAVVLPGAVFLGGALVDVMVNVSNAVFLPPSMASVFPLLAFGSSAFIGMVLLVFHQELRRRLLDWKSWLAGIALGIPNFLSILFLLKALRDFDNNGAVVFPVLNISVILLNSLVGIFVFKETPGRNLIFGLGFAVCSLVLILQNG